MCFKCSDFFHTKICLVENPGTVCLLPVRRTRTPCDSADVLSRALGIAGVLGNEDYAAVLRRLQTDGLSSRAVSRKWDWVLEWLQDRTLLLT